MTQAAPPAGGEARVAKVKRHGRVSPAWLIPIVAAVLVAYLGYTSIINRGPLITITLSTADGLTVDQTQVKHKNVTVGTVDDIALAKDMKSVVVKVRMASDAKEMLTDRARFWVVRPRLSASSLTGIETLVSGSYIEVDPGEPGGKKTHVFKGLEEPPGRQSDEPGQVYVLKAKRLGSLGVASPIYYRDVEVGEVLSYDLGEGLGPVTLRVFVREPYDKFVHPQTRFWNASGLAVTMGAEGLHIEMQSIATLLSGGIAFETPRENEKDPPAEEGTKFDVFDDKASADTAFYRENIPYVTYFETSVQGLSRGSPVKVDGVQVGSVTGVGLVYDPEKHGMIARVAFELQPERVLVKSASNDAKVSADVRAAFSEPSMKVVLESSSLLTGAKDLSIIYAKASTDGDLPKEGDAFVLRSEGGGLDGLTASLADIASKVDKIPFQKIGDDTQATMQSVHELVAKIDSGVTPTLAQLPIVLAELSNAAKSASGTLGAAGYGQDSEFQRSMQRTMSQVNDAARSFRVLADYLDRHPEALIRGRAAQAGER